MFVVRTPADISCKPGAGRRWRTRRRRRGGRRGSGRKHDTDKWCIWNWTSGKKKPINKKKKNLEFILNDFDQCFNFSGSYFQLSSTIQSGQLGTVAISWPLGDQLTQSGLRILHFLHIFIYVFNDEFNNNNLFSFQAWNGRNLAFGGRYNHLKTLKKWPLTDLLFYSTARPVRAADPKKSAKYMSGGKLIWGIWCEHVMYRKWTVLKFVTKRTLVEQMMFFSKPKCVSRNIFSFLDFFTASSGLTISEIYQKSSTVNFCKTGFSWHLWGLVFVLCVICSAVFPMMYVCTCVLFM